MRLYNAQSCTPVGTSSSLNSKQTAKTFVQKDTTASFSNTQQSRAKHKLNHERIFYNKSSLRGTSTYTIATAATALPRHGNGTRVDKESKLYLPAYMKQETSPEYTKKSTEASSQATSTTASDYSSPDDRPSEHKGILLKSIHQQMLQKKRQELAKLRNTLLTDPSSRNVPSDESSISSSSFGDIFIKNIDKSQSIGNALQNQYRSFVANTNEYTDCTPSPTSSFDSSFDGEDNWSKRKLNSPPPPKRKTLSGFEPFDMKTSGWNNHRNIPESQAVGSGLPEQRKHNVNTPRRGSAFVGVGISPRPIEFAQFDQLYNNEGRMLAPRAERMLQMTSSGECSDISDDGTKATDKLSPEVKGRKQFLDEDWEEEQFDTTSIYKNQFSSVNSCLRNMAMKTHIDNMEQLMGDRCFQPVNVSPCPSPDTSLDSSEIDVDGTIFEKPGEASKTPIRDNGSTENEPEQSHSELRNFLSEILQKPAQKSSCVEKATFNPSPQPTHKKVSLKDDPAYSKYFKMLKIGLDLGTVKHAMERDGLDSTVMDGDHNAPVLGISSHRSSVQSPIQKDLYRRTRFHWDTISPAAPNSVWALMKQDPGKSSFNINEEEFKRLFQTKASNGKQLGKVVDGLSPGIIEKKRANNGGITLAGVKLSYEEITNAVDNFDTKILSQEHLKGMMEFLPTAEEQIKLKDYLSRDDCSINSLNECEKFMAATMSIQNFKQKVEAILFMKTFESSASELRRDANLIKDACEEVSSSLRFRQILGLILCIGNRLNTAGLNGSVKAKAFNLDSLLKLKQVKAFDKKTTLLRFVASTIMYGNNDKDSAQFINDFPSVFKAQKINWELTKAEVNRLGQQLDEIQKIALVHSREVANMHGNDPLEKELHNLHLTEVGQYALRACGELESLVVGVEKAEKAYNELLVYFGEENNKQARNPHMVFEILSSFCKHWKETLDEVNDSALSECDNAQPPKKTVIAKPASRKAKKFRGSMGAVLTELRKKSKVRSKGTSSSRRRRMKE